MYDRKILWQSEEMCNSSNMKEYTHWINSEYGKNLNGYEELWEWSIQNTSEFWDSILKYFKVIREGKYINVLNTEKMPGNVWFEGLNLNYAENAISLGKQEEIALFFNESGSGGAVSRKDFVERIGAIQKFLIDSGVVQGDTVASMLPNVPEAMEAMFATTSLGAVWSGSSPDFGSEAILDRFSQIKPRVLFAVDSYSYNGKRYDKSDVVKKVIDNIRSIERVVILSDGSTEGQGYNSFEEIDNLRGKLTFKRVPFGHPLWILYSSGTTGPPKAIVQSHGGILLEHLKLLSLRYNLRRGNRFFWFSTTGWMMWNVLVSSIATGATAVLYDGSPTYPDDYNLWRISDENRISFFGTSAAYISHLMKEKARVIERFPLKDLFAVGSTGSPLSPEAFRYVYQNIKTDLWLASISGGTDLCTAFLGGCLCTPVVEGELQCINLGADIQSYNEEGEPVVGKVGELVLRKPMPSMPIYLWNDDGEKLKETYFSRFPGVWRHGDWVTLTPYGSAIILGRSDSTLKRRGIRIGTAEIYGVLDSLEEVKDSIIVGLELKGGEYYMPLFVVIEKDSNFEEVKKKIGVRLRDSLSPRHVPDEIIRVSQIPRTINGKKMEVPLKKLLMGVPVRNAVNLGSMANPESLKEFEEFAERTRTSW